MYIDEIYNTGDETINFKETYIHSTIEEILNAYMHSKIKAQVHEFNEATESIKLYTDKDILDYARTMEELRARDEANKYAESKREEVAAMVNEWANDMSDEDFKDWYINIKLEDIKDCLNDVDGIEEAIEALQDLLELAFE